MRCLCCKEIGHSIENCVRDPNFKTNSDTTDEQVRLNQIRDFKKVNADTLINTTHFFKKSVMVPVNYDDEGTEIVPPNANHPFMRGIMNFDDYNYQSYNRYILTEEPGGSEQRRIINDRRKIGTLQRGEKLDTRSSLSYEDISQGMHVKKY